MKTIEEIRDYLLKNRVDGYGDLMLSGLDFSDFEGDVYIDYIKTRCDLYQDNQKVQGDLYNRNSRYGGNLYETPPTKLLKEITLEELEELGYKLKENDNDK